jgi:hypothetical protein
LSHGVDVRLGVSRITAWLTQASDKVLPGRASAASVTTVWNLQLTIYDLALLVGPDRLAALPRSNHQSKIVNHKSVGVSRITAWLTQASDKVLPGRAKRGLRDNGRRIYDL